ncbi:hypothetical protein A2434_00285 [Candidatus Woesebacteria bacterium RIFOXYC1_FULL_41_14]|uniref:Uncharacterized protein n=5 Tax=Candidatus Woeseibacteriota TaxID=1752722 RepID=A0A0G0V0I9_9BACT|nr:MAG: hypothetical protein UT76_C0003G0027 [Candidatus Woesebacteria bacterium GW2011_GWB1_40_12]KKR56052.1 MAG: hypothetical protein UT93_C0006G0003 [Candidatus Woesebacteria bacterium GW2011_GWF1_40_24]KKS05747.1 MAG: hypothetical protein UU57_C0001G0012 [Candidatus Woesebacteria bacterium GW2011_GWE1_41_24]OGM81254.1 MAG: hypothetical protein A2393_03265 [Candidatus Woesebacteria bacterium RIFOXYB1_FULL_41_13]OGM84846.1 MAG: hypothetical protein A2434_00285 [Candidatus Woesebacteria bacter
MAQSRTRKNKKTPNYGFLVSWEPKQVKKAYVKRESKFDTDATSASTKHVKKADSLAQPEAKTKIKKDIIRSLTIIGLILILELVIYLAWNKFIVK